MLYLLAIFFPWLALLLAGKPFHALFSFLLWLVAIGLTFVFGLGFLLHLVLIVDACVAISRAENDKRTKALIGAMQAANNQTTNTQQGRAVPAQD